MSAGSEDSVEEDEESTASTDIASIKPGHSCLFNIIDVTYHSHLLYRSTHCVRQTNPWARTETLASSSGGVACDRTGPGEIYLVRSRGGSTFLCSER